MSLDKGGYCPTLDSGGLCTRKKERIRITGHIDIDGAQVRVGAYLGREYLNLNDMVRHIDGQRYLIEEWIRAKKTLRYLAAWEKRNNPHFDQVAYEKYMRSLGQKSSSVGRWAKSVNAIGLFAEVGRYGGTYANTGIVYDFATYLDARYQVYFVEEFERTKKALAKLNNEEWDLKRELSRTSNHLVNKQKHNNLLDGLPEDVHGIIFATEADVVNKVWFEHTHQEWKSRNPKLVGNQRQHGTAEDNIAVSTLENYNAIMIRKGLPQHVRYTELFVVAGWLREDYADNPGVKRLNKKLESE